MSSRARGRSNANWRSNSNSRRGGFRGRSTYTDRNTTIPADGNDGVRSNEQDQPAPPSKEDDSKKKNNKKSKRKKKKKKSSNAGNRRQTAADTNHPTLSGNKNAPSEGGSVSDLRIVAVDYTERRNLFYTPTFGPLEEVYSLIRPRMDMFYLDFMRSRNSGADDLNYKLFYQNFAFRLTEIYLAKLWLYNSPNRLLDANFAKIRELLVVKFPVIKEFFSDVASFIGDFILFEAKWINRLPLVIIAHHWLQAGYGKITNDYHRNNFHGLGCNIKQYGDLPILITPFREWPFPFAQIGGLLDAAGNILEYPYMLTDRNALDGYIRTNRILNPRLGDSSHFDYRDCSFYLFNCMVSPTPTWLDYFGFPQHAGVDPFQVDFYRNPDSQEEVFPIPFQPEIIQDTASMFLRMFPWRVSFREKSPFIIQFNCHFVKHFGLDENSSIGIEDYTPSISRSLAYLIGAEIDDHMRSQGLKWYLAAGIEAEFQLSNLDVVRDMSIFREIAVGNVRTVYYDENGESVVERLALRYLYKLPLYYHAIVDAREIDNMDGFLHLREEAVNGVPTNEFRNRYDLARHWWRWCMAGILPRWVPASVMSSRVDGHFDWARSKIQLDFLRKNLKVEDYVIPSSVGSPLQLSYLFKQDEVENLYCVHKCTSAEASSGFIVTDRICALSGRFRYDVVRNYPYRFSIRGGGEARKIQDLTAAYFPQEIWTIR